MFGRCGGLVEPPLGKRTHLSRGSRDVHMRKCMSSRPRPLFVSQTILAQASTLVTQQICTNPCIRSSGHSPLLWWSRTPDLGSQLKDISCLNVRGLQAGEG